jgi:tetratricopeptide (TPR) repeat protein
MYRLYILILAGLPSLILAQGIGEFADISNVLTLAHDSVYTRYLRAARLDRDSTKVAVILGLQGRQLTDQQRYLEAERCLFQSLEILEKKKGSLRHALTFTGLSSYDTYDYIGEYYSRTGDNKKAEYFFKQSEQLRDQYFSRGSFFRIFNIQNLAIFYLDTRQNDKAEIYLTKL